MYTLQDAKKEKELYNLKLFAKMDARAEEEKRIETFLLANPDVGVLIKNGKKVFYRFINGKEVPVII